MFPGIRWLRVVLTPHSRPPPHPPRIRLRDELKGHCHGSPHPDSSAVQLPPQVPRR
jgi:hypothetical protein